MAPSRLRAEQVASLAAILCDDHVLVDDAARRRHAGGLSYLDLLARRLDAQAAPDAVVLPGGEADVADVLAWCEVNGVAAVTFGGGTSVVGGLRIGDVDRPTIMISTARLDDVLDIDVESHLVTVGRASPARGWSGIHAGVDPGPLPAVLAAGHHRGLRRHPVGGAILNRLRPFGRHGGVDAVCRRRGL